MGPLEPTAVLNALPGAPDGRLTFDGKHDDRLDFSFPIEKLTP